MSRVIDTRLYLKYTYGPKRVGQPRQVTYRTIDANKTARQVRDELTDEMKDREDVCIHNGVFGMASFFNSEGKKVKIHFFQILEYNEEPVANIIE